MVLLSFHVLFKIGVAVNALLLFFFLISFQLLEFREWKKPGDGQAFLGVDELWKV